MSVERTFIMIKPDGFQRQELVGEIINRFIRKGLKLVAMKAMKVSEELAKKHYADLSEKPFFGELVAYIVSGPVIAMVFEGVNAVAAGRQVIGATNPMAATCGTIRGDFATTVAANMVHGSDSVENGLKEIALWFKAEELLF
eukprot:UN03081